jgi:cellulose synthase/poly-beta-1,6-N-acetylglucosamine synthase-like glycosyltransferase
MQFYRILSWFTLLISIIILIIIPLYTISSLILIISSKKMIEIILNLFLLLIEEIGYLYAFYIFYMISGAFKYRQISSFPLKETSNNPHFTVIVPSHGTPFSILKKTLVGTMKIDYNKYDIIVSDNGQVPQVTKQLKEFCDNNRIQFFHKQDLRGFKAGNINAVLDKASGEFIVILDSDHIPISSLLSEFAKVMIDEKIGYVQAKVSYRNTQRLYQAANSILYSQFYEVIEAGKDPRGVVLFNGTTGCFRKNVLLEINGFSEETLIEDIDTSIKILSNGYQGRYINIIGSYGLVPETAKNQISQLWRWAHGACTIIRLRTRSVLTSSNLDWKKKIELLLNVMAFFAGTCIIFLVCTLALMIIGNFLFLRPEVLGFHLGFLMPTLVGAAYILTAILAIFWESRKQSFFVRVFYLIPFLLFSLGTFLYLVSGVIEGFLLKNTPMSESSVWNRDVHVIRNSILALCLCGLVIGIGILGLIQSNEAFTIPAIYIIGGALGWILAPLSLLKEEIFPPRKAQI